MKYKIENEIIGLTETISEDIQLICQIEKDPSNNSLIISYDKDRHQSVIESKDEEHLTIWEKKTKKIIGFIILAGLDNPNLSLEFRRIVIQSKGNGFGRLSLRLIKQHCFERLKFNRLWLDVFDDNERAINLYETEGFQIEGHLREVVRQGAVYRDLILLSMLAREYKRI
jgi:RimJ/RimL family protein N-acetyltransferase